MGSWGCAPCPLWSVTKIFIFSIKKTQKLYFSLFKSLFFCAILPYLNKNFFTISMFFFRVTVLDMDNVLHLERRYSIQIIFFIFLGVSYDCFWAVFNKKKFFNQKSLKKKVVVVWQWDFVCGQWTLKLFRNNVQGTSELWHTRPRRM